MCDPIDENNWHVAFKDMWWDCSLYRVEINNHELDVFARVFRLEYGTGKWEKIFQCSLVDLLPTFLLFIAKEEADAEWFELFGTKFEDTDFGRDIDELMERP